MKVAIIGAGISGLGVGYRLIRSGFHDFIIYEAQNDAGGRIKTLFYDGGFLEMGAQWIHGQEDNILFELASKRNLVALVESHEGVGHFCTNEGKPIDSRLVTQVIMFLDGIKMALSNGDFEKDGSYHISSSVAHVFRKSFEKWIKTKKCSPKDEALINGIFDWFMRFETIDNSCLSLDQLSVMSYTLYKECEGVPLNNLKHGYSSIVEFFLEEIPAENLKLNTPIKQIKFQSSENKVCIITNSGQNAFYDHVVVTSSIGFLASNLKEFFYPSLPSKKVQAINSLGFGTVNKIFMVFEKAFWNKNDLGFQLVWLEKKSSFPSWVYDISGVDTVQGQPNVLVVWIGGQGAQMIELESEDVVISVLTELLENFLSKVTDQTITKPLKLIRTNWYSNPYIKGSYSNRGRAFENTEASLSDLISPIFVPCTLKNEKIDWPVILFAGEATSEKFFSTTHGALETGYREAERLLKFWYTNELIPKNMLEQSTI